MHHHFIDYYAQGSSVVHQLDARTKLIVALLYTGCVVAVNKYHLAEFVPMAILPFAWITLGGIPWRFVGKQILLCSPFILAVIVFTPMFDNSIHRITINQTTFTIAGGYIVAANLLFKYLLGITTLVGLASTTRFDHLLLAMRKFHLPDILIVQLAFLYRYLFELIEQAHQMLRAREARSVGRLPVSLKIRSSKTMVAMLFIRSYESSKKIFQAMQARGYDGKIRTMRQLRLCCADIIVLLAVIFYLYFCFRLS